MMTILVGCVCENGQKVKSTWIKKDRYVTHTNNHKAKGECEADLVIMRNSWRHIRKKREGQKELERHAYTQEKTGQKKGRARKTFLLVQQIFIGAKTDPEKWGKQTGEAI